MSASRRSRPRSGRRSRPSPARRRVGQHPPGRSAAPRAGCSRRPRARPRRRPGRGTAAAVYRPTPGSARRSSGQPSRCDHHGRCRRGVARGAGSRVGPRPGSPRPARRPPWPPASGTRPMNSGHAASTLRDLGLVEHHLGREDRPAVPGPAPRQVVPPVAPVPRPQRCGPGHGSTDPTVIVTVPPLGSFPPVGVLVHDDAPTGRRRGVHDHVEAGVRERGRGRALASGRSCSARRPRSGPHETNSRTTVPVRDAGARRRIGADRLVPWARCRWPAAWAWAAGRRSRQDVRPLRAAVLPATSGTSTPGVCATSSVTVEPLGTFVLASGSLLIT